MSIDLKNTADAHSDGVKILVYGHAGVGKTTLSTTMPNPVIISAEGGLLSIKDASIPYIEVKSMDDLKEAYAWLISKEGEKYDSVIIDSLSEISEVILIHEKTLNKDGRAAYGEMAVQMLALIRSFRDLKGKNVLMTAKVEKSQDESGRMLYAPSMAGNKVGQALPYFFDLVVALRVEKDADGIAQRALMCDSDGLWLAKDRSGKLQSWEQPDISEIITKIGGE